MGHNFIFVKKRIRGLKNDRRTYYSRKNYFATLLYLLVFQTTIKLHDYLMIKKIRREARNDE